MIRHPPNPSFLLQNCLPLPWNKKNWPLKIHKLQKVEQLKCFPSPRAAAKIIVKQLLILVGDEANKMSHANDCSNIFFVLYKCMPEIGGILLFPNSSNQEEKRRFLPPFSHYILHAAFDTTTLRHGGLLLAGRKQEDGPQEVTLSNRHRKSAQSNMSYYYSSCGAFKEMAQQIASEHSLRT